MASTIYRLTSIFGFQGLFFDEQEVPEVPTEAHDQFLDYIVTPTRTISADGTQP
jgi:hypothetical protein